MSILVLRPGLFHKIKASNKQDLYALEIENPYIKTDLIRMEDNYGRKNLAGVLLWGMSRIFPSKTQYRPQS